MKRKITFLTIALIICVTAGTASAGIREKLDKFAVQSRAGNPSHEEQPMLDPDSQACLYCHDGSRAICITVKSAGAPMQMWGFKNVNHPIGMLYSQSQARSPDEFIPVRSLNPRIELIDGKVGCRSCHLSKTSGANGFSLAAANLSSKETTDCTATGELTVWGSGSVLCLSCHNR
jgi:hypothetical protein